MLCRQKGHRGAHRAAGGKFPRVSLSPTLAAVQPNPSHLLQLKVPAGWSPAEICHQAPGRQGCLQALLVSIRPQPHSSSQELSWSRHGGQHVRVAFTYLTTCIVALFKWCCSPLWHPCPNGPVACSGEGTPGMAYGLPNSHQLLAGQQKHPSGVTVL